jgi:hypothetical protein
MVIKEFSMLKPLKSFKTIEPSKFTMLLLFIVMLEACAESPPKALSFAVSRISIEFVKEMDGAAPFIKAIDERANEMVEFSI